MKTLVFILLAILAASSVRAADVQVERPTEISFENCQKLDKPIVFKGAVADSFLLIVNSCQKNFYEIVGLVQSQNSPASKKFGNTVQSSFGFGNNAFFYSETLKILFETSSEDNVYSSIVQATGLKRGHPQDESDYMKFHRNQIIRDLQVVCEEGELKAMSQATDNYPDPAETCTAQFSQLPPTSLSDQEALFAKTVVSAFKGASKNVLKLEVLKTQNSGHRCELSGPNFVLELSVTKIENGEKVQVPVKRLFALPGTGALEPVRFIDEDTCEEVKNY